MRNERGIAGFFLAAVLAGGMTGQTASRVSSPTSSAIAAQESPEKALSQRKSASVDASAVGGSEACSACHAEIYKSYMRTVMAQASGEASGALITGEFLHRQSGVRYRVYREDGSAWMSYERASEKFRGQRELRYFIGSGVKARNYLFSDQGFLFGAPINWNSQEQRWNLTPAYTEAREIPLNLPTFPDCLNCHASGLEPPVVGTENRFPGKPFLHNGITCQRCHGEGEGHGEGKGSIVNPAKLPGERRDGICMECHFEGVVATEQPGRHLYQFQPGERLSDYIHYFLLSFNQPRKAEALSQVEALSLSECKRKSGDKMWCGTCHDPHKEPESAEKAAYYRGKCVACHGEEFAAKHHADKPDCTKCHMPALPNKDVTHTEATDHRIRRNPNAAPVPQLEVRGPQGAPLVSFPEKAAGLATARDFGLAWERLALRNVEGAPRQAEKYLRKAVAEGEDDPVVLATLGRMEQQHSHENEARELYERALKLDPLNSDAAVNLGILLARSGDLRRAVELWQGAFAKAPYRSATGINLAMAFCGVGQVEEARKYVGRVLEFNPDYEKGKLLLEHMKEQPVQCKP